MDFWSEVADRLIDGVRGVAVPESPWLLTGIVAAAAIVLIPPVWRHLRQIVTVVHELGHAVVGVVCGRTFTGFVVNSDMSGHTVTSGKSRGIGLILTMYAGYPMPAIVGGAVIFAALSGRSGLVLIIAFVLMAVALIRSKSGYTVLVLILLLIGTGWVWWMNDAELSATVVSSVGILLLVGAWRQFGSVVMGGGSQSDPAQLARITRVPAFFWNLLMLVPIATASWWATGVLIPVIQGVVTE